MGYVTSLVVTITRGLGNIRNIILRRFMNYPPGLQKKSIPRTHLLPLDCETSFCNYIEARVYLDICCGILHLKRSGLVMNNHSSLYTLLLCLQERMSRCRLVLGHSSGDAIPRDRSGAPGPGAKPGGEEDFRKLFN